MAAADWSVNVSYLKMIFLALVMIVLVGIIMMNPHFVTINLDPLSVGLIRPASLEAPLAALILGAAFLGLLIGVILEWIREAGERREKSRAERRVAELEAELATLRPSSKY